MVSETGEREQQFQETAPSNLIKQTNKVSECIEERFTQGHDFGDLWQEHRELGNLMKKSIVNFKVRWVRPETRKAMTSECST